MIVALDGMTDRAALGLIGRLGDAVRHYKVGLELYTRYGPDLVRAIQADGRRVFLDVKYHDIPATVERAVAAAAELEVFLVNVHAAGGAAMLEAAVRGRGGSGLRLIAVTVLTSKSGGHVEETVVRRAVRARDAGADGVVAAVGEVGAIRAACGEAFLTVTPGIRPAGADRHDQARVATPAEAVRAGSDYIVVGRAITAAADPVSAAREILGEVARG
jgi:orotidine-5'-phosphate decarboxylase